jgi:hypothetical protein
VLCGRFGSSGSPSRTLVPLPTGLTVEAVDKMDSASCNKAYTSYIGPIKRGDRPRVQMMRKALKHAINSRA